MLSNNKMDISHTLYKGKKNKSVKLSLFILVTSLPNSVSFVDTANKNLLSPQSQNKHEAFPRDAEV